MSASPLTPCAIHSYCNIHWTAAISLPVRPPTLLSELESAGPALLNAELAEDVTLVRPSDAFEVAFEALSLALAAD